VCIADGYASPNLSKELIRNARAVAEIEMHVFAVFGVYVCGIRAFFLIAIARVGTLVVYPDDDGGAEFEAVGGVDIGDWLEVPTEKWELAHAFYLILGEG